MKKLLCILIISLASIACNRPANKAEAPAGLRSGAYKVSRIEQYRISGTVLYQRMWCGGVQIRPGDNSYKLKPYAQRKLLLIKGMVNSDTCIRLKEIITNAKGEFSFEAGPGPYGIVIEDWKQHPFSVPAGSSYDKEIMACMRNHYKTPDLSVQVTNKAVGNLTYTVIGYCSGGNVCQPRVGGGRP
jgi:hypothetical protein